jgi:hypothetical protein
MRKAEHELNFGREMGMSELDHFLGWLKEQKLLFSRQHVHGPACHQNGSVFTCGYTDQSFEPILVDASQLIAKFRASRTCLVK